MTELTGDSMTCRKATMEDAMCLFHWANDPVVRQNSIHPEQIKLPNHLQWFAEKLSSGKNYFFIFEAQNRPVAHIRFDVNEAQQFVINFLIDKEFRGKGLAATVVEKGMEVLISELGYKPEFRALVKPDNLPSVNTFIRNMFFQDGETVILGNKYLVFKK